MRKLADFDYMLPTVDNDLNKANEDLRIQFVNQFSEEFLKEMNYTDFIMGQPNRENFCYQLEHELRPLGSIVGATSSKFGMYRQPDSGDIILTEKWNVDNDIEKTFEKIRVAILSLLDFGRDNNKEGIVNSQLSSMFKHKILAMYFPKNYLNIFSKVHLNYFISQFYEDVNAGDKFVEVYDKQMELIRIKEEHPIIKDWNNIKYGTYLYHLFPKIMEKNHAGKNIKFEIVTPEVLESDLKDYSKVSIKEKSVALISGRRGKIPKVVDSKGSRKIDFSQKHKRLADIGNKGEEIVVAREKETLQDTDFYRNVKQVSLVDDSLGYDVRSFELDGQEKQIEVKSTTQKKSSRLKFYLSENEFQKAQKLNNYWIYQVFDVEGTPEIIKIKNPFTSEYENKISMIPVNYYVEINTEDKID